MFIALPPIKSQVLIRSVRGRLRRRPRLLGDAPHEDATPTDRGVAPEATPRPLDVELVPQPERPRDLDRDGGVRIILKLLRSGVDGC